MMPGRTAAFSFENSPTACAAARPASHATLRRPAAEAPFTWHNKPANTPKAASRSARPTILVTDSVSSGCNPQIAASAKAGAVSPKIRTPSAYTSATLTSCSTRFTQ